MKYTSVTQQRLDELKKQQSAAAQKAADQYKDAIEEAHKACKLEEAEFQARRNQLTETLIHAGLIDFLRPSHGRTSCSDESPINDGRCDRCSLLNADNIAELSIDINC